jgi:hypothetical protein
VPCALPLRARAASSHAPQERGGGRRRCSRVGRDVNCALERARLLNYRGHGGRGSGSARGRYPPPERCRSPDHAAGGARQAGTPFGNREVIEGGTHTLAHARVRQGSWSLAFRWRRRTAILWRARVQHKARRMSRSRVYCWITATAAGAGLQYRLAPHGSVRPRIKLDGPARRRPSFASPSVKVDALLEFDGAVLRCEHDPRLVPGMFCELEPVILQGERMFAYLAKQCETGQVARRLQPPTAVATVRWVDPALSRFDEAEAMEAKGNPQGTSTPDTEGHRSLRMPAQPSRSSSQRASRSKRADSTVMAIPWRPKRPRCPSSVPNRRWAFENR